MAKTGNKVPAVPSFGSDKKWGHKHVDSFAVPKFHLQDPRLWHYRACVTRVNAVHTIVSLVLLGTHKYSLHTLRIA